MLDSQSGADNIEYEVDTRKPNTSRVVGWSGLICWLSYGIWPQSNTIAKDEKEDN